MANEGFVSTVWYTQDRKFAFQKAGNVYNLYDIGNAYSSCYKCGELIKTFKSFKQMTEFLNTQRWIEEKPNDWTYRLKCPCCGYSYNPRSYEDGTVDEPVPYCPFCKKKLGWPE